MVARRDHSGRAVRRTSSSASTSLAILLYILTSWVRLPYSLEPVQRFLYDVCEPYLRLWRRICRSRPARSTSRRWSPSSR